MGFNDINLQVSGPIQPASIYKTKVLKGQVPFATQVTEPNTKYVIKHNFVLDSDVTIPENCILEFDGGSISGAYTVTFDNTYLDGDVKFVNIIARNVVSNTHIYSRWFSPVGDGVTDDRQALQNLFELGGNKNVHFDEKTYLIVPITDSRFNTGSPGMGLIVYQDNYDIDLGGATIKLAPNNYVGYCIIAIYENSNITIKNGHLIGDKDEHDYSSGATHEHGLGLKLQGCSEVIVDNMECYNCTGDGFNASAQPPIYGLGRVYNWSEGGIASDGTFDNSLSGYTSSDYITLAEIDSAVNTRKNNLFVREDYTFSFNIGFATPLRLFKTLWMCKIAQYDANNNFISFLDRMAINCALKKSDFATTATKFKLWICELDTAPSSTTGVLYSQGHYNTRNFIVSNCKFHNNRRQGITLGGTINASFKNCEVYEIRGTSPQACVDIEEGQNFNPMFESCIFRDSKAGFYNPSGFQLLLKNCEFADIEGNITLSYAETSLARAYACVFKNVGTVYEQGIVSYEDCDFRNNKVQTTGNYANVQLLNCKNVILQARALSDFSCRNCKGVVSKGGLSDVKDCEVTFEYGGTIEGENNKVTFNPSAASSNYIAKLKNSLLVINNELYAGTTSATLTLANSELENCKVNIVRAKAFDESTEKMFLDLKDSNFKNCELNFIASGDNTNIYKQQWIRSMGKLHFEGCTFNIEDTVSDNPNSLIGSTNYAWTMNNCTFNGKKLCLLLGGSTASNKVLTNALMTNFKIANPNSYVQYPPVMANNYHTETTDLEDYLTIHDKGMTLGDKMWSGTRWVGLDGFAYTSRKGTTANRPVGIHTEEGVSVGVLKATEDVGFEYFDTDLGKPIYASAIQSGGWGTVTWKDATGATV